MSGDPALSRAPSLLPREPRRVGRFEFLMRLGQGGMATVYLARALGTGGFQRLVAIKLMHQFLGADDQFVEMFLDEARVAAHIRHPNVVSILDLGNESEQLYMVMDYVEGDTLAAVEGTAARLGRAIPLGVVLRVVLDALSGLDAAHELKNHDGTDLKVVHRDVSPQNILVGIDGAARLTDFGIARAEQRIATTRTGMLKGKAPFMAPEQFEGRPVDRRADVFAMGVTLWEAVALRRLFPARETYEQALRNARAPYRKLREILPSVPSKLDDIVRTALAHDPKDRFPTAAAFADALETEFRSTLATHRQVGSFMAAVAAEKIQRERDAVRNAPKPAEDAERGRNGVRTAIRNTYGTRKNDEPVSAATAQAFESLPPVNATGGERKVSLGVAHDDDPEVAAALQLLDEMPIGDAEGDDDAAPLPARKDEAAEVAGLPAPQAVVALPKPTPRAVLDLPLPRGRGAPTVDGTPRAKGLVSVDTAPRGRPANNLQALRRDPEPAPESTPAAPVTPARRRRRTTQAGPQMREAASATRGQDIAPLLMRDVGGVDASLTPAPTPLVSRKHTNVPLDNEQKTVNGRAGAGTGSEAPPRMPRRTADEEPTVRVDLTRSRTREILDAATQAAADTQSAPLKETAPSVRAPPVPANDTRARSERALGVQRVAQFPSLTPSPKDGGVLAQRWVPGAVLAAVLLVLAFVLTR